MGRASHKMLKTTGRYKINVGVLKYIDCKGETGLCDCAFHVMAWVAQMSTQHLLCHNKPNITFFRDDFNHCRDFHQRANDKSAEVSCLFTSSVISRVCACVWLYMRNRGREQERERERVPICTTTTNKWVWFITSFLLSMNSARPEGLVYTLSSGFSTVQALHPFASMQVSTVLYAQDVFVSTQPHTKHF